MKDIVTAYLGNKELLGRWKIGFGTIKYFV